MIPKATVQYVAQLDSVLASTIEKDYALGWLLYGIAQHSMLSRWVFKGGTCLKKCFFETYRFSEDLDFTIPADLPFTEEIVRRGLAEVCEWVSSESGVDFPRDRLEIEVYTNKQGTESINAKATYSGPLGMKRGNMQRIKLDLTQNEVLVDPPKKRAIFHRYEDRIEPAPSIACYTVNEILAEKTRALYERQGRARDVYDLVSIDRNFRDEIVPERAREILNVKFAFKKLSAPSVASILARVDFDGLAVAWEQQLSHQLPLLPPVAGFVAGLKEALAWWIEPQTAVAPLLPAPVGKDEQVLPREHFVAAQSMQRSGPNRPSSGSGLDRIRFAARNRLCVAIGYDGVDRVVEPYSLRYARTTGNTNLFVYELLRSGRTSDQVKSFNVAKLESVTVLHEPFTARWIVEL